MNFKEFIKPTITKIIISILGSIIFTIYIFLMLFGCVLNYCNNRLDFKIAEILLWPLSLLGTTDILLNISLTFIYLFMLIYIITSLIILIRKRK